MRIFLFLFSLIILLGCQEEKDLTASTASSSPTRIEGLELKFIEIDKNNVLTGVHFVNEYIGYVSGYNGKIYKTVDGGDHWAHLETGTSYAFTDICFTSVSDGFAIGTVILGTHDGGETWKEILIPRNNVELRKIYFINSSRGFAIGQNIILRTVDSGVTWEEYAIEELKSTITDITFLDEQFGVAPCLSDKLLVTKDGGDSWSLLETTNGIGYYSASIVDQNNFYVSGQGKIYSFENGGHTSYVQEESPDDIYAIYFINKLEGFAFGRGNSAGNHSPHIYGSIYYTKDGGQTWAGSSDVHETPSINSVSFPANTTGYALGRHNIIKIIPE